MKNNILLLFILALLQTSYVSFAQTDSLQKLKPKYRFAISIGFSLNNFYTATYNPMSSNDYKEKVFLNSIYNAILSPSVGIHYQPTNRIAYCMSLGIAQFKANNFDGDYYFMKRLQAIAFNYETNFFLIKRNKIRPFIGIGFRFINNKLLDDKSYVENSNIKYYTIDKSNLFLLQIPVGFLINKHHFVIKLSSTFNLISFSLGKQNFTASSSFNYYKTNETSYSKFIFTNKFN